ncbi:hypothetical protein A1Q2_03572 [Trichosporon asahii var. asahii CBS 8904]|uniref:Chromo domain-containing protein n=1 Tax=Trichosporon asahii var. asahii (strain CBS 8904) TaxID=1220162 RepID=K1VE05_TRIAC|nr:hypothetical protein A1Q2_03572 [Trichosporon asahii var. asahii CBS 8904]
MSRDKEEDIIDVDGSEGEEEYEVESITGFKWEDVVWKLTRSEHAQELIDAYFAEHPESKAKRDDPPVKKRGRPSKASSAAAPTPKKPRASRASQAAVRQDSPPESEDETNIEYEQTYTDGIGRYDDVKDWEKVVESIDTVERNSENSLIVYLTM